VLLFAYKPTLRLSQSLSLPTGLGKSLAVISAFALSGFLHEGCLLGQANLYYDEALHSTYGHTYIANESQQVQSQYGFGAKNFSTTYAFAIQGVFITVENVWLEVIEKKAAQILFGRFGGKQVKVVNGSLRSFLGWLWTMSCMMYTGYILTDLWYSHGLVNAFFSLRLTSRLFRLLGA
jgi:hypothetical protein